MVPKALSKTEQELRAALLLILDQVDYTAGACSPTDMIAACLPTDAIERAKAALTNTSP